jgi:hypothetical protein
MNQISKIPFGSDASVLAGCANRASAALGNFDLVIENTGANNLAFQCRTLGGAYGTTWTPIESFFTVVPSGVETRSYSLVNSTVGFFGSGNTCANVSTVLRNKADLRGSQISMMISGKRGWNVDAGYNTNAVTPPWGNQSTY